MTRKTTALTIAAVAGLATAAMALTGTSTTTNKDKDGCQSACTMTTQAACGWGDKDGEATAVTMVSLDDHAQMGNRGNRGNGADGTIVQVASEAGQFETLLAAAKAAGLAEALSSSGPLTVFAPTDEAFAKLGQGTINDLLKPENKQKLVSILTYHVVSGELPADKVLSRNDATTLNGQRIDFSQNNRGAFVDGARIIATDVAASNGVIHVIDSVIMPESKNLAQIATGDGRFTILAKAVEAAGLTGALTGSVGIFAPVSAAWSA